MSRTIVALVAALAVSGCTHVAKYDPTHLATDPVPEDLRLDGRVLVMTAVEDDGFVYSGHPSSLTGAATTLTLPIGEITREAAVKAFGDVFRGGVDRSNHVVGLENYRVVVAPRTTGFDYKYNALRNLGFAITPEASVQISVTLLDAQGRPTWQKTYQSGTHRGSTYVVSFSPGDRVGQATHRAILAIMQQAAADVKATLAAPAPVPSM